MMKDVDDIQMALCFGLVSLAPARTDNAAWEE